MRPGERIDIVRYLSGARASQRDPYAVLTSSVSSIIEWCTRPLAWSFTVPTDVEYWGPFFDYLGFRPLLEVPAFGLRHVIYGMDWRRFPVEDWLDFMNEREHSGGTGPPPPASMLRPEPLSRAAYGAAVRGALQDLHRPDRLALNPLVGTRLGGSADALRAAVVAAVDRLGGERRGDQLRAVLHRTFLKPAPTQEAAAEVLGLPFSTYRRHLGKAVDQLTEALWAVEIGAAPARSLSRKWAPNDLESEQP